MSLRNECLFPHSMDHGSYIDENSVWAGRDQKAVMVITQSPG